MVALRDDVADQGRAGECGRARPSAAVRGTGGEASRAREDSRRPMRRSRLAIQAMPAATSDSPAVVESGCSAAIGS